jgi:hypothetical protein
VLLLMKPLKRELISPPKTTRHIPSLYLTLIIISYEDKCARDGQPASHAEAKEIMAGLAGAAVDRVSCHLSPVIYVRHTDREQAFETKGLDWLDRVCHIHCYLRGRVQPG